MREINRASFISRSLKLDQSPTKRIYVWWSWRTVLAGGCLQWRAQILQWPVQPHESQLVLEITGEDSEQNRVKRQALALWVDAVNQKGGFGTWCADVVFEPGQLHDVLERPCTSKRLEH